ncbi:hypothetical protein FISHEDRAFT_56581 [Fistulina hepatica ATCC 64428]|uniref:Uncharacterized protein n=1 Tax=Fistulina hepatica ATCC 64428 TaxID=1128425 RepID=A0A0D7AII8_9AGAR|nr:hypothetical protein FISHEDRAFT_56581 [Fistulina hepatica ATCC 64428]
MNNSLWFNTLTVMLDIMISQSKYISEPVSNTCRARTLLSYTVWVPLSIRDIWRARSFPRFTEGPYIQGSESVDLDGETGRDDSIGLHFPSLRSRTAVVGPPCTQTSTNVARHNLKKEFMLLDGAFNLSTTSTGLDDIFRSTGRGSSLPCMASHAVTAHMMMARHDDMTANGVVAYAGSRAPYRRLHRSRAFTARLSQSVATGHWPGGGEGGGRGA